MRKSKPFIVKKNSNSLNDLKNQNSSHRILRWTFPLTIPTLPHEGLTTNVALFKGKFVNDEKGWASARLKK